MEPTEKYLLAVDKIRKLKKDFYSVSLAGGEPTVHPGLQSIAREFSIDKNCVIAVHTNFSKDISYFENIINQCDNENIFFEPSIHLDHIDQEATIDKIKYLSSKISMIHIMANPKKMNNVKEFYGKIAQIAPIYSINAGNGKQVMLNAIQYDRHPL